MQAHDELIKKLMQRPGVRFEVERIEKEESALLDARLKASQLAGLVGDLVLPEKTVICSIEK